MYILEEKHKRVKIEDIDQFINEGWIVGRLIPDIQKQAMKNNRTTVKDPLTGRFMKGNKCK